MMSLRETHPVSIFSSATRDEDPHPDQTIAEPARRSTDNSFMVASHTLLREFCIFEIMKMTNRKKTAKSRQGEFSPLDRRYDVGDVSSIDASVLDTFPYEYRGKNITVAIDTDEFTAVCPWSGLPDFGTIRIEYIPRAVCIELRSLKYYLLSYRNVGIYQEHAANRILEDLVLCADPAWMRVTVDYRIRGGVHTVVHRDHTRKKQ
jgi:7-cyano-7-deazaguanine reductase